jgi:hypothetical protein
MTFIGKGIHETDRYRFNPLLDKEVDSVDYVLGVYWSDNLALIIKPFFKRMAKVAWNQRLHIGVTVTVLFVILRTQPTQWADRSSSRFDDFH